MNWRIVDKSKTIQPSKGKYSDWKSILAEESHFQCVYCSINDGRLGGIRNFHVEHYKPKSLFSDLKHKINNLFYACPICNVFKGDDWHDVTGDVNDIFYPDPSNYDLSDLFEVREDGILIGKNNCGTYLINKLALNRNQLIIDRKFNFILREYASIIQEYRGIRDLLIKDDSSNARDILRKLSYAVDQVLDRKDSLYESIPYVEADTKRSS